MCIYGTGWGFSEPLDHTYCISRVFALADHFLWFQIGGHMPPPHREKGRPGPIGSRVKVAQSLLHSLLYFEKIYLFLNIWRNTYITWYITLRISITFTGRKSPQILTWDFNESWNALIHHHVHVADSLYNNKPRWEFSIINHSTDYQTLLFVVHIFFTWT